MSTAAPQVALPLFGGSAVLWRDEATGFPFPGTVARALYVAMVNARRDPPDAALRHAAGHAALSDPDRIA